MLAQKGSDAIPGGMSSSFHTLISTSTNAPGTHAILFSATLPTVSTEYNWRRWLGELPNFGLLALELVGKSFVLSFAFSFCSFENRRRIELTESWRPPWALEADARLDKQSRQPPKLQKANDTLVSDTLLCQTPCGSF